jgi:hypothetical protein
MTLDLAGFKRRRKSLTHSALKDLVAATTTTLNEERPVIVALHVDPLTLGTESARFLSDFLRDCTRRNVLQELVIYCPQRLSAPTLPHHDNTLLDDADNGNLLMPSPSNQVTGCRVDALLRAATFDGRPENLAQLRAFQSNLLPSCPGALTSFFQSASRLQEVRLGHDGSGVSSAETASSEYLTDEVARAILDGLEPLATLRVLKLSSFHGEGVRTLVSSVRLIACVELELEFTPELIVATRQLLVSDYCLRSLTLANTSPDGDVDCGPLLASLSCSNSIQHLTLKRFAVTPCDSIALLPVPAPLLADRRDGRNSSLRELCLNACRLFPKSLVLPVTGLHRMSLKQCTIANGLTINRANEGPEALIRRIVYHAALSSFWVIGPKSNPDEVLRCYDPKMAEQVLTVVQKNPNLCELDWVAIPKSDNVIRDLLEYYLKLNQAGRGRDVEGELPPSLIPVLLIRHAVATESRFHRSILYHFVKRLVPLSVKPTSANN